MNLEKMVDENVSSNRGKLIVIEGVDGVGKSTQYDLLKKNFEKLGYVVKGLHFPTHGVGFYGNLVDDYLNGKFGKLSEIPPRFSAFLYAGNREENSDMIKSWLDSGNMVLLDRYVSSAMSHQGSNIESKEKRLEFYNWLETLEYDLNKIPKPDMVIVLDAELETIKKSVHDRGRQDIHESDPNHLKKAINVYRELASIYSGYWKLIKCDYNGKLKSREDISEEVFRVFKENIKQ